MTLPLTPASFPPEPDCDVNRWIRPVTASWIRVRGMAVTSEKAKSGSASKTTVTLTGQGRAALDAYTRALRGLLSGL
jgi:hypothetical protein